MMKKTILTLSSVLFCVITFAQSVPQGINYQAVARDTSGAVLMNQNLTIQFSVISDITTSAISWQETHSATTNHYGLFTAIIGQGTSTSVGSSATFDVIDWGASNHLLKVEIDYGGGLVDMGTTAFMSVPYALQAGNTETLPSGTSNQTLRHDGNNWVASNTLLNNGNQIMIGGSGNSKLSIFDSYGTIYGGINLTNSVDDWYIFQDANHALKLRDDAIDRLIIDNAGNVGIGTVTPNAKLDIHHAGAMIQMENSNSGHQWEFYTGGSAGDDGLGIYDRTNSAYRLVIDNGGNIGIGTTTPSGRLNVDGGSDAEPSSGGYIMTNSVSSTNIVIDDNEIMARDNGSTAPLYLQNNGGDILIGAGAAGGMSGIKVKIGPSNYYTGSTSNMLQVAGTIGVEYVPTWNGSGFYDMTWDNSTKTLSKEGSSLRFKKNIKPMQADFSKILQIEPKDYQMREGYGPEGDWVYGYIAEELDQLGLRKLVTYDQEGRPDGIHYKKISMYNLEIIKEQQKMLDEQQQMIKQLQEDNQDFKDRITLLENK